MFDPALVEATVDFLAELAGAGRALELGIGTGRIAVPLAARGVPVHGVDMSRAMVARLREKPGAEQIGVTIGDFATATVDGTFALAYLVFNTINNLTTQAEQVACFRNVAAHLEPGGCFVVEVGVPGLQRLPPGERFRIFEASDTRWGIDEYDVATQGLVSHHFEVVDGRIERLSIPFRYVWPAELDLMAELAGMRLRERWSGWKREPFTSESRKHVSVWEQSGGR
jgi:SAM-dependent methyltransferase